MDCRYVRLTVKEVPYAQCPCISGLRLFGRADGDVPAQPVYTAERVNALDMRVDITESADALGYNILWGSAPDKLYHSLMVFSPGVHRVGAMIEGRSCFVRADAFNECGITEGTIRELSI